MPSHPHENPIEFFRNQPRPAADLLDSRPGVTLPHSEQATLLAGGPVDLEPTGAAHPRDVRDGRRQGRDGDNGCGATEAPKGEPHCRPAEVATSHALANTWRH